MLIRKIKVDDNSANIENNVYLTIHRPPAPIEQVDGSCLGDTKWTCIRLRKSSNAVLQPITPEPTTSTFIAKILSIYRVRKIVYYVIKLKLQVRYAKIRSYAGQKLIVHIINT